MTRAQEATRLPRGAAPGLRLKTLRPARAGRQSQARRPGISRVPARRAGRECPSSPPVSTTATLPFPTHLVRRDMAMGGTNSGSAPIEVRYLTVNLSPNIGADDALVAVPVTSD